MVVEGELDVPQTGEQVMERYTTYPSFMVLDVTTEWPWIGTFFLDAEVKHRCENAVHFSRKNYWIIPAAAALYLLFCFLGPKIMKSRKAFDLKTPLQWWNLTLAIFSLIGASRVLPHLALLLRKFGLTFALTAPPPFILGTGPAGLWTSFFVYSKLVELLDTVFIVLRKRELNFLHWYHHVTVMLYSWDAYTVEQPAGFIFVCMNYTVHALMYFYFFLTSRLNRRLPWGRFVTIAQISQMFVGVAATLLSLRMAVSLESRDVWTRREAMTLAGKTHHFVSTRNLLWSCVMYSTFMYLFVSFFFKRYVVRRKGEVEMKADKTKHNEHAVSLTGGDESSAATLSLMSPSETSVEPASQRREKFMSDVSNSTRSSDDEIEVRARRQKAVGQAAR